MEVINNIVIPSISNLKNIVKYILNLTECYSVQSEVLIKSQSGVTINIRHQKIELIEFNNDSIIIIKVYKNYKRSIVSSTKFDFNSIKKVLDIAIEILNFSSEDFYSGLPHRKLLARGSVIDLDLCHSWNLDYHSAVKLVMVTEQEAFKVDKRIVNTEGSSFCSCFSRVVFGNSYDMLEHYDSTLYSMSSCIIAKENNDMQRDFYFTIARSISDLCSPQLIGTTSAQRALKRLHPKKLLTMKVPVIFISDISADFFSYLAKAISGDRIYNQSTFLLNSLETRIFPDWLTIKEDPFLKRGLGSKCFDSEGVRTLSKKIVHQGILKTWLLDTYSAKKLDLISTGNSGGMHNWIVQGYSQYSLKDLLKIMNKGLLVTEFLGQGLNIITGDYSQGISGFWIDNGNVQYPVSEVTISGNLLDMFKNIMLIGKDINYQNKIQSGSILLSKIQISGL